MIKGSYRAFTDVCYLVIELIRQFYTIQRTFRIVGENGGEEFVQLGSAMLGTQPQGQEYGLDMGSREPIFDVKVRAHKANAFSRLSQNELAKEFYSAGFFNPQLSDQALACLSMMDFEGKDEIERRIAQNGTMYQQIVMMQQQIQQLMGMLGMAQPEAEGAQPQAQPQPGKTGQKKSTALNAVRDVVREAGNPEGGR